MKMPDIELKNSKNEDLIFDDSKKTNSRGETILGTFEGPCADIIDGTRNGRHYSEALWKKVFNDPIVKELFECGGILGELDHPSDREETKTSEVAICMSEPPKKGSDGLLYGKWDVLDTPNGRIAATLAKYGYKFGISSRGSGDTYTDYNGNEEVDPDSYDFQAFDLVILPAVKKARLTFSEGLERNTLGKALTESLNKANPDERIIMENTLRRLNIKLEESKEQPTSKKKEVDDIDEVKGDTSVDNNEDDIVTELQEALNSNQKLENKIVQLQEKLSACYTRESEQENEILKYKKVISNLVPSVKKVKALEEKLSGISKKLDTANNSIKDRDNKISTLNEKLSSSIESNNSLDISIKRNETKFRSLQERYQNEIDRRDEELDKKEDEINSLNESLLELKKDIELNKSNYSSKIDKANKLVEKYKRIANKAVDRYIESQALKLGADVNEIKNKLPASYTFDDIDTICENLQEYKLNMNRLPFRNLAENYIMKVTAPKTKLPIPAGNFDDDIDDGLISLAGLK